MIDARMLSSKDWSIMFQKIKARLVHVFKQQFLVFLEIRVDEKVCESTYNVV